jgi:hypothetical protein
MDDNSRNEFEDPFKSDTDLKDFGLPEVNFKPIEREEPNKIIVEQQYKKETPKHVVEEKKKNNILPVLIGAFVLVLIFGLAIYFFAFNETGDTQASEYVPYEPEIAEVIEETPVESIPENFETAGTDNSNETVFPDDKKEGSITVVNQRTRRGYIVVGSFFDEDNATDFGNKLAANGEEVKLIKPDRYSRYYKLAVADYDNYDLASNEISNFKTNYGNQIWVLKY